jgi:hypothetical protein
MTGVDDCNTLVSTVNTASMIETMGFVIGTAMGRWAGEAGAGRGPVLRRARFRARSWTDGDPGRRSFRLEGFQGRA